MPDFPRVFVSRQILPAALARLREEADVDLHDSADPLSADELRSRVRGCRGLVSMLTDRVSSELVAAAPDLQVIANVAVGFDNIDVAAATGRGILVTNTPDVLTEATADFTFALLLAAARRVVEADRFLRAGRWRR